MAHNVTRIERDRIYNQPQLISASSFEDVVDYLNSRPEGLNKEELAVARDIERKKVKRELTDTATTVIPVSGVLTYKETFMGAICGMSSYQGILEAMEESVRAGFKTVVLDVDSGGGEAYGTFETAQELRNLADEYGVRLVAYVDGISASAAYGLSVAADEIILNPYAEVGSIGVVTKLRNDSEKMKKEGIKDTYVYAGTNKIPYDSEGEWREDFIASLQSKVDVLYEDFVTHVSSMRSMSQEDVRATEAKMFSAKDAIEMGLADKVMTRIEFMNYLADIEEGKDMPLKMNLSKDKPSKEVEMENENPVVEAKTGLDAETQKIIADMQAQIASLEAEKTAAEKAKLEAAKSAFSKELSEFAFVSESLVGDLTEALFGLEDSQRDVVLAVFGAADEALAESVSTVVAEEVENEPALSTDKEAAKEATRLAIQEKYNK